MKVPTKRPRGRPKSHPTATRSLRLPIRLWEALDAVAKEREISISALMREASELAIGAFALDGE